jgi:hypothetical protein
MKSLFLFLKLKAHSIGLATLKPNGKNDDTVCNSKYAQLNQESIQTFTTSVMLNLLHQSDCRHCQNRFWIECFSSMQILLFSTSIYYF